jgi:hypothetical protein
MQIAGKADFEIHLFLVHLIDIHYGNSYFK